MLFYEFYYKKTPISTNKKKTCIKHEKIILSINFKLYE